MSMVPARFTQRFQTLLIAASLSPLALMAQTIPPPEAQPALRGSTLEGKAFDLQALRGKVVMVVFWSTDCAVCRDKMPELRANVKGWMGQPFQLISVSTDRQRSSAESYTQLINITVPANQRFTTLWSRDVRYHDTFGPTGHLPAAFLLDKSGRLVEQYHGRIPAEAWDRIADLL